MTELSTPTDRVVSTHPIATVRSPLELVGLLLVLGAALCEVGFLILTLDSTDGAGDFFVSIGVFQLWIVPLAALGVLVALAPRLFFRWDQVMGSGVVDITAGIALVVLAAAAVFAGGATGTYMSRASDEEYDAGAGDWLSTLGVTVVALAGMMLAVICLVVAQKTARRPIAQPVV
jgi:hypothetical protein